MRQYLDMLEYILVNGRFKGDRTGTGTQQVFGYQNRYNLGAGLPVVTTKSVHLKSVIHELLWFLSGSTNNNDLKDKGVSIWNSWGDENGYLGPIYSKSWTRLEKISLTSLREFPRPTVILDPKKVAGVGVNGDLRSTSSLHLMLYATWNEMLHRCYDAGRHTYTNYGARGVFVDGRWHDFANFVEDASKLGNWLMKYAYPDEYFLDKDFFGTNKYGPDTCIWLSRDENTLNTRRAKVFVCTGPQGQVIHTMNLRGLCLDYRLDESSVYKCARGEKASHKGWSFRAVELEGDIMPRVRLFNQMKEIVAQIRHAPNSRRIILDAWNATEVEDAALPPCHSFVQFDVTDGELSLQLYQRSADAFLGVPFNIASYAILVNMICHVTGLKPGTFIHTFGDLHIYNNHREQVFEQLKREPRPLPSLRFARPVESIFDFNMEDFIIEGYDPHPAISAPVAV
jgi:thymidylate synthase